jgi:hypothetical protein
LQYFIQIAYMKIIQRYKILLLAIFLSLSTYGIFYGQFLSPSHYFWGSDAQIEYVPARVYLYDKIVNEHSFPFWTEKMYSGFPIYADLENAYMNPVNVASILIFGPHLSYKILHLLEYLIGSLSLFFLLRRKGIGILGYAVANVIFYFNTFLIDHQIHFNIIMAFYLIPTAFLLADMFIEKRRLLFILLQSFIVANAVLWGHMQSAVIIFMGIFLYMAVFSYRRMRIITFIFYFALLTFLITAETLPQVWPSFDFFSQSSRESSLDYLKGSLTPRMAIFSFVPYLLGGYEHFIGKKIDKGFTYTEIYTYLGISSVFLSALALLLFRKSRDIVFAYATIWIFLIFSFMSYNKLFPQNMPLITLFRDWIRVTALSSFGVALLVGMFVDKIEEISYKNIRFGTVFISLPLAYIFILDKIGSYNSVSKKMANYTSLFYIQAYPYFSVLRNIVLILILTIIIYLISRKFIRNRTEKVLLTIKLILLGVVFFDLLYFGKDVLAFRLQDISNYKIKPAPQELTDKRVVLRSTRVSGMESLYYDVWSPYGYSQFKEDSYEKYFNRLGLGDIKYSGLAAPKENYQALKDAGIVAIVQSDGIITMTDKKLDILKNDLDGEYIEKKEGKIIMSINNPENTIINTYLKYNPHWKIKIDGQETQITKNGVFFDFPLNKGNHKVEIYYYPKPLIIGTISSLMLIFIIMLLYFLSRKNLYIRIFK